MNQYINEEFGEEFSQTLKNNWKRCLDDCFIIWNKGDLKLHMLNNIPNDLDPDIKFTLEKNSIEIPFLDVLVKKENDKISTDIFNKRTDTHLYLHFGSYHPRHIKRAIPYNIFSFTANSILKYIFCVIVFFFPCIGQLRRVF